MPSYYLSYVTADGDRLGDLSDPDFDDLASARRQAVLVARDIMADRLKAGLPIEDGQIEITDDSGRVLSVIELIDAVRRHPDGDSH